MEVKKSESSLSGKTYGRGESGGIKNRPACLVILKPRGKKGSRVHQRGGFVRKNESTRLVHWHSLEL